ncbi:unnamed protein product [Clavelina lepadiformis]|uniref:Uncharacterized protein n=1 Tax=Clavelina lepadiformis TaxID=159417 RepID=A0ABP0G2R5_CLALP
MRRKLFYPFRHTYLPDESLHHDHEDGGLRTRPAHCTSGRLTPAITPNESKSVVQFLLVGTAFALSPDCSKSKIDSKSIYAVSRSG